MEIINASKENAGELAYLINLAGEGIPAYLWQDMAEENESPLDVGNRCAAREEGNFSYRNAKICVENNALLGMLISYRQPDPYTIDDILEYPELVRPLIELEARAPGSWYINAIATYEEHRGKGVASMLLAEAEALAKHHSCKLMSLIVASENNTACRLYKHLGFKAQASLAIIPYPGCAHGGNWVLMTREI
jgi:ribosomal protein S18 acetylase RimI-like enzyme